MLDSSMERPNSFKFTGMKGYTYLFRVLNVGLTTSINVRIQGHTKLVEVEGSHTMQEVYESLDIHVGQSMAFLVTLHANPKDYYIVASTRFTKPILTATAILHYQGSDTPASKPLPIGPTYQVHWSMKQARTIRWNLTANAARPNPQGAFHYGTILVTRTLVLANSAVKISRKNSYAINKISYINPDTPLKLADYYNIPGVFQLNKIKDNPPRGPMVLVTSVFNFTLHDFVEIVFQNNENFIQSYHLDGNDLCSLGCLDFGPRLKFVTSRKLPPGPFPLPIIGNLHLLGNQPHKSLAKLANFHGPIMRLKLGQVTTVVISSSNTAKQVLQTQDLAFSSSRSIPDTAQIDNYHMFSVSWLPVSPQWRNLRKILNSHIFSVNKLDATQHLRYKKIEELVLYCRRSCEIGKAVDIGGAIFRTLLNLLSNTFFSKDLANPYENSGKEFKELVEGIMLDLGKLTLVDYFPVLKIIDPYGLRRYNSRFGKLLKLLDGLINERLELRKLKGPNTDVLDALLTAREHNPQEIDRNHITTILLDLFVAGTDTSSNIVEWAMAEILKAPEIMMRVQAELVEVIGEGNPIEEADVGRLPYLQCIIKETFRMHPPGPLSVPRKVEQDVEVCGYTVPKGSKVLINVWAIGQDSTFWEDPSVFNPDRFKDSKLDVRGQDFELIPFGAGRRICPGLPLAIRMVPVMLGTLLNTFKWKIEGDIAPKDLDMQEKFGLTLAKLRPLRAVPLPL